MSVIEATSAGVKDMADGSLRITFEFDPRHAAAAFALFGVRGRAVAVAALKDGSGAVQEQPKTAGDAGVAKGGELAKLAGIWSNDPAFIDWADMQNSKGGELSTNITSPEDAALWVRIVCGVASRAELDHDADAAERFHRLIRGPFAKHQLARGVTA